MEESCIASQLPGDVDAARAYDRVARESRSEATSTLRAWNNAAKNYLLQYAARLVTGLVAGEQQQHRGFAGPSDPTKAALRVVELACGRGGEMHKWAFVSEQVVRAPVDWRGLDVSAESVAVLRSRFRAYRHTASGGSREETHPPLVGASGAESEESTRARFCVASASETLPPLIESSMSGAHIVSMQMAFHYMWRTRGGLETWCANVSRLLVEGGACVVTYFDAPAMLHHALSKAQQRDAAVTSLNQTSFSFLHDSTRVEFDTPQMVAAAMSERHEGGIAYRFTMAGSVDGATEFTVCARALVRIARRHGLELLRVVRLIDLPVRHAKIDAESATTVLRGALSGSAVRRCGVEASRLEETSGDAVPDRRGESSVDTSTEELIAFSELARLYRGLILVKRSR